MVRRDLRLDRTTHHNGLLRYVAHASVGRAAGARDGSVLGNSGSCRKREGDKAGPENGSQWHGFPSKRGSVRAAMVQCCRGRKVAASEGQKDPTARFTSSYSSRWPAAEKCASPGMKYLPTATVPGSWKKDGNPFTKRTPCSAAHFCQCVTW